MHGSKLRTTRWASMPTNLPWGASFDHRAADQGGLHGSGTPAVVVRGCVPRAGAQDLIAGDGVPAVAAQPVRRHPAAGLPQAGARRQRSCLIERPRQVGVVRAEHLESLQHRHGGAEPRERHAVGVGSQAFEGVDALGDAPLQRGLVSGRKLSGTKIRTLLPVVSMKSLPGKSSRMAVTHSRPSAVDSTTSSFHRGAVHHE